MKLQILSDIHLEFAPFVPLVCGANVVILAGDIGVGTEGIEWAKKVFDTPVIYVPGNHEYHDPLLSMQEIKAQMRAQTAGTHVHYLDNDVVIINGVRFIGSTMWGDLAQAPSALYCDLDNITVDYEASREVTGWIHFTTAYAQELFEENRAWLKSEIIKPFDGKTVVVTHHAPSQRSLHMQYAGNPWNPCFITNMEDLMGGDVDLWVHGHTHNNFDYEIKKTRVVCNPKGYPNVLGGWENPLFNSSLVLEI